MLDGKVEHNVAIDRMTTIPMPHRGETALLRTRTTKTKLAKPLKVAKSNYAKMSAMDLFQWGLQYNLRQKEY